MNRRIAGIELRRSAAPWMGVLIAAVAWALTGDPERWDGLWMATVLVQYSNLQLLWPLVLAAGAWQGRRDRAARVTELLAATPRPGASRMAPLAVVLTVCLVGGYLLSLPDGLGHAVLTASYQPPGWYWPLLVGVLGIAAAGMLGLGLGRLMPSRLTAPLLGFGGLVLVITPQILWEDTGSRALLLLPGYLGFTDEYSTVDWRGIVGQAAWLVALTATGWVLLANRTRRGRLLAVLPAALGLAVALSVLPPIDRVAPRDPRAVELVCADGAPRVCVTRLYEPILPQLVGPARLALAQLARLPDPPTAVVQETALFGAYVKQRHDTVHLDLTVVSDGTLIAGPGSMEDTILEGAGTWNCGGADDDTWTHIEAARVASGLWLRGADPAPQSMSADVQALVDRALATLRALPADEQLARVAAMREAALDCRADLYDVLTGAR